MKRIFDRHEPDNWILEGDKILSDESIEKIKTALLTGPIIVQHWFYRGASCPRIYGFDDYEEFEEHLTENAVPGDAFDIWSFSEVCTSDKVTSGGKMHDIDGRIPEGGAY